VGNSPIIKRITITSGDGWVKLSSVSLVADFALRFGSGAFSVRIDGGTAVALNVASNNFKFQGIDLSRIEISTASGVPIDCYVVGNTRGA
jgi:hypothetical protein